MFGCAPDTGNLGVSALHGSVVAGLVERGWRGRVVVADHSAGVSGQDTGDAARAPSRFGYISGRRFNRPENASRIRVELASHVLFSASARVIARSVGLLDISGGDSFTDLYGPRRFRAVCQPKLLAMQLRKPLILLPQTYGPYREVGNRELASRIARYASQAWARDARSFEVLKELLGQGFDPSRHRMGVDVAFLLPTTPSARDSDASSHAPAGLNVSGLIWNDPAKAVSRYGFKADYREALVTMVSRIAGEGPVVLVPHVITPRGHYESDRDACLALVEALPGASRPNVRVCENPTDASRAKGIIASCGWFCGTRMHATIAALSSGVPTAAISYSDKTLGVFETCGQGEHVHDPRTMGTAELVERVLASWERRAEAKRSLAQHLPGVLAQAERQMDEIAAFCQTSASKNQSTGNRARA